MPVQINISARHGHLSDETKAQIRAKAERLMRLFDRLLSIEVTVDLEHAENPSVDVRVSAEHKHDFVATDQASSLMAALDGAVHKLEGQLRKYKEKLQSRHRAPRETALPEGEASGD